MKQQLRIGGTRLVSVGRNIALSDRYDSARYELPSGRFIIVKTICEMEFNTSSEIAKIGATIRIKWPARFESDMERDRR